MLGTSSKNFVFVSAAGQAGKFIQNRRMGPTENSGGRLEARLTRHTATSVHFPGILALCAFSAGRKARLPTSQSWLRKASARLIHAKTASGNKWVVQCVRCHVICLCKPGSHGAAVAFARPFQGAQSSIDQSSHCMPPQELSKRKVSRIQHSVMYHPPTVSHPRCMLPLHDLPIRSRIVYLLDKLSVS